MATVQYTLKVKNNGSENATGVVVQHKIDFPCVYINSSHTLGSYVDTTGQWTIGNLAVGSEAIAIYTIEKPDVGSYPILASVQGDQIDGIIISNVDNKIIEHSNTVKKNTCADPFKAILSGDNLGNFHGILEFHSKCLCENCDVRFSIVTGSFENIDPDTFNLNPITGVFSGCVTNQLDPWEFWYQIECINCIQDCPGAPARSGPWGPAKVAGAGWKFDLCKDESYVDCCDEIIKVEDPNVLKRGKCEGSDCLEVKTSDIIEAIGKVGLIDKFLGDDGNPKSCDEDPCALNVLEVQTKDCGIPKIGVNLKKIRELIFSCTSAEVQNVMTDDTTCSGRKVYDIRVGDTPCGSGRTVYYLHSNESGIDVLVSATGQALVDWPKDFSGSLIFEASLECIDGADKVFTVTINKGCCDPCFTEYGSADSCATKVTAEILCTDEDCADDCWINRTKIIGADNETICRKCEGGEPNRDPDDISDEVCPNRTFIDRCGFIVDGTLEIPESDWYPLPSEVCLDEPFTQKSQCCPGVTRTEDANGNPLLGTVDPGDCNTCHAGVLVPICKDPLLPFCDGGDCVECLDNCHCDEDACKECVAGVCVNKCTVDAPYCDDCGECVKCRNNADCDPNNCEVCTRNGCESKCKAGDNCIDCQCVPNQPPKIVAVKSQIDLD